MTFDARELSTDQGAPVEFFRFTRGVQNWYFTSADRDTVVESNTYVSTAIARDPIESTTSIDRSNVTITVPRDNPVADLYRIAPPSDSVLVTVRDYHDGDGELVVAWIGRIASVAFKGSSAEITCQPAQTAARRTGLRRVWQRNCPHVLYGSECKVSREAFKVPGVVQGLSGLTVSSTDFGAKPDNWFAGGYLELDVGGVFQRRFITDHIGNDLTLVYRFPELKVGSSVNVYPGCAQTRAVCDGKFGNILNHGGAAFIPLKNPFGSTPVY